MANEQITFDKLPQAVGYLTEQMEQIRRRCRPAGAERRHRRSAAA